MMVEISYWVVPATISCLVVATMTPCTGNKVPTTWMAVLDKTFFMVTKAQIICAAGRRMTRSMAAMIWTLYTAMRAGIDSTAMLEQPMAVLPDRNCTAGTTATSCSPTPLPPNWPSKRCTSFEKLFGDAGNDLLFGNIAPDYMFGGSGNDTLYGDAIIGPMYGCRTDGRAETGANDILVGDSGEDALYGGGGDDQLWGSSGSDVLEGEGGADVLYGGTDVDFLLLDVDPNLISATSETFDGHFDNAPLGEPGAGTPDDNATDILVIAGDRGSNLDDHIVVHEIAGQLSIDYTDLVNPIVANWRDAEDNLLVEQVQITGGLGDDYLEFSREIDVTDLTNRSRDWTTVLLGGPGNDTLVGGAGRDQLDGGAGNDELYGYEGDDRLWGDKNETGSIIDFDSLFAGQGNDDLIGGLGRNTLAAWSQDPGSTTNLQPGRFGVFVDAVGNLHADSGDFAGAFDESGNPVPDGQLDDDPTQPARIQEDTGLNRMLGSAEADTLFGGTGVDFMYGNGGPDTMYRSDGSDFESLDDGFGGDAWKEYAKATTEVWYVGASNADDVIAVDFVTEPGVLEGHHLVTRLTNNNGNYSFAAEVQLDFEAVDSNGQRIWDPNDIVARLDELQTLDPADRQLAYDQLLLDGGLLPPEGDFQVILIDALAGNDQVTVGPTVQKTVWVDAGPGDDRVEILSGTAIRIDQLDADLRNDEVAAADELAPLALLGNVNLPVNGRLSSAAIFAVDVNGRSADVYVAASAVDQSQDELVNDINLALRGSGLSDLIHAGALNGRVWLAATDAINGTLELTFANNVTSDELGWSVGQLAERKIVQGQVWKDLTLDSPTDVDWY